MAPSINGFKLAVFTLALLFSITSFSSPKSVHGIFLQERKLLMLGSRPPECVNGCSSCRPCMATLVVPSHHHSEDPHTKKPSSSSNGEDEDDTYYLLSWKCRCGDKIFPPRTNVIPHH